MTREEMWKEFENQLIRETRTPITESYDASERMTKSAIKETVAKWKERLEQEPCNDAISREEVIQSRPEWLSEDVERDTDEQTVVDKAFNRGWNSCLKEFLKNIKELPSVTPKPKTGHWVKVTNGRDGHECDLCHEYAPSYQSGDEYLTKYCPNCGAKMIEPQESEV